MLVLLIYNDQPERFDGGKDRGARANDDAGAALADFMPLVMTLAGRKMAVQHGNKSLERAGSKPGFEPLDRLRRERNFGHEDDGAFALFERVGDRLEIYFGFAAASDAVEEENAMGVCANNLFQRGGLLVIQRQRLRGEDVLPGIRIALGDLFADHYQPFIFEAAHGFGGGAGKLEQFLQGHLAPFLDDVPDFLLTLGEF